MVTICSRILRFTAYKGGVERFFSIDAMILQCLWSGFCRITGGTLDTEKPQSSVEDLGLIKVYKLS